MLSISILQNCFTITDRKLETCIRNITVPGPVLSKTDYLAQYDRNQMCSWIIKSDIEGVYPLLNVSRLNLAPQEYPSKVM